MAKPSRDNIQNGNVGWDASVNNNFIRLFDQPAPIFLHSGDESDLATSFNPNNFEECIVIVDHTVVGLTPYIVDQNHPSGSNTWVPLGVRMGAKIPPTFETGTTTLGPDERRVIGNPGGAATYTLPPAADMAGLDVVIKNISVNQLTVDANGAETIDGALTFVLPAAAQYTSLTLYSDGTDWHII